MSVAEWDASLDEPFGAARVRALDEPPAELVADEMALFFSAQAQS